MNPYMFDGYQSPMPPQRTIDKFVPHGLTTQFFANVHAYVLELVKKEQDRRDFWNAVQHGFSATTAPLNIEPRETSTLQNEFAWRCGHARRAAMLSFHDALPDPQILKLTGDERDDLNRCHTPENYGGPHYARAQAHFTNLLAAAQRRPVLSLPKGWR
jgi:hypothetical protein